MISRRRLLAALAGAATYPTLIEPRWFEVTHTAVGASGNGPRARLLHLSDFHASWAVPLFAIRWAIDRGLAERPDFICVTGDFITHREDFDSPRYVAELKRLPAAAPTFAILGNHDGGIWAKEHRGFSDHKVVERMLDEAGIQLLHNRSTNLAVRDRVLQVVGVGDLWSEELNAAEAFRNRHARADRTILLSHNPDSKDALQAYPWDLMLCGHTHGGQVIIPFEGPCYAPVADLRFVAGLNDWDGRRIYTSRGIGNVGSVRFRCRPEIAVLDLGLA